MRVLFWSELFWSYIGGVEVLAARLLPVLRARGYEFAVVTRRDSLDLPGEDQLNGIPIYRFPFRSHHKGAVNREEHLQIIKASLDRRRHQSGGDPARHRLLPAQLREGPEKQ